MELNQNLSDLFNNSTSGGGGESEKQPNRALGLNDLFDKPAQPVTAQRLRPVDAATLQRIAEQEGAGGLTPVISAIYGQESGSGANSRTSIDGAQGGMQVIPATFQRYAKPGERIDNPDDNMRVGVRIIKDLATKFGNDPAKIATGYFSGEGNVNPGQGSAWKNDARDGNGKSVSGYVSDVLKRVGAPPAQAQANLPDLDKAPNWADIVAKPDWRGLPEAEKAQTKAAYFDYWIAPHAGSQRDAIRAQFLAQKDPAAPNEGAGAMSDAGNLLGIGVNSMTRNVRELVGRIPGVGESIVRGVDAADKYLTGRSSEEILKGNIQQAQAALSPEMQAAGQKKWWDAEAGTFGDAWKDPRAYASGVLQSLPEQVVTMFPAMRLAKGIYASKIAAGVAPEVAANAAARAAAIAGGASEGALAGAASSIEVRDKIMAMTPEQLQGSEAMKALISQGMSFEDAKRQIANDSATQAFITSGLVTGAFGGFGDRVLAKALTQGVGKNLLGRVGRGVVGEGVLEEFPQEFGSAVAENMALQNANPAIGTTDDALNRALGGLATGGLQGGAMAAFGRNAPEQKKPEPVVTPDGRIEPAESAAPEAAAPEQPAPVAPAAPAAPVEAAAPAQEAGAEAFTDQDVLDFAATQRDRLLAKRDGTRETVVTEQGAVDQDVPGVGLTPAEERELATLEQAGENPAALRSLYGFDVAKTFPVEAPPSIESTIPPEESQNVQVPQEPEANGPAPSESTGQAPDAAQEPAADATGGRVQEGQVAPAGARPAPLANLDLSGWTDEALRQQLRNSQDKKVRAAISAELAKRKTAQQTEETSGPQAVEAQQAEAQGSEAPAVSAGAVAPENKPKKASKEDLEHLFGIDRKRQAALDRIAKGTAYFATPDKAKDFIKKNGLADTHEAVKNGKRFEIVAKAAAAEAAKQPSGIGAEPHTLTAADWHKRHIEWIINVSKLNEKDAALARSTPLDWREHEDFLETALEEGKTIPQQVLNDYRKNGVVPDAKEYPKLTAALKPKTEKEAKAKKADATESQAVKDYIEGKRDDAPTVEEVKAELAPKADDFDAMFDDVLAEELAKDAKPKTEKEAKGRKSRATQKYLVGGVYRNDSKSKTSISVEATSVSEAIEKAREFDWFVPRNASPVSQDFGSAKPNTEKEARAQRTATESLASAAKNTAAGLDAAIDGLGKLFGGPGRLNSGLTFDEETYAKAKPLFLQAIANLKDAGSDLKEAMRTVVRMVLDKFGAEAAGNMKPYVVRFIEETAGQAQNAQEEAPNDSPAATDKTALDNPLDAGQRPQGEEAPTRGTSIPRDGDGRPDDRGIRESGGRTEGANDEEQDLGNRAGDDTVSAGQNGAVAGSGGRVSADFRPAAGGLTREGSWFDTAKRNIDLIELAIQIDKEGRAATPDEQALLSKYVGFGAGEIRNKLFPVPPEYLKRQDPNRLIWPSQVEARWKPLAERIEALPREWQKSVLQSSQYAHYTSENIIRSMWSAMQRMGFTGGKVFEPGMGIGSFSMLMPDSVRQTSRYTGVEFDGPTALIARLLSPEQNMLHDDFIKRKFPKNFFDVAIGNPPFSQTKVLGDPDYEKFGFMLHDFFFAKSIDRVRPGGLLAFVTSKGTMDKQSDKARKYLAERADLLGAIRLPSTAFEGNAGTSVVTDVIFLRKRMEGEAPAGEAWNNVASVETKDGAVLVNEYFANHPEMVLGQQRISGNVDDEGRRINSNGYGGEKYTVVSYDKNPAELDAKFAQAIERLPVNAYSPMGQSAESLKNETAKVDFDPSVKREGVVYLDKDGTLMRVESGVGRPLADMMKLTEADKPWFKDYIGLRDLVQSARLAQATDGDWEAGLKALNKAYDAFRKTHGPINDFRVQVRKSTDDEGNTVETEFRVFKNRRRFREDYDASIITQLETINESGEIVKAPFLLGRTIGKPITREVKTIGDALAVSLDMVGGLDLDDVAKRINLSKEETIEALGNQIYKTPDGEWQLVDEYLSGDVVAKLEEAEQASRVDSSLRRNVEALKEVQPEKLGPSQISAKLGASWIPEAHVNEFATEIGAGGVTFDTKTESWQVEGGNQRSKRTAAAEYGTAARSPSELLEAALNSRSVKVMKSAGDNKVVVDQEATSAANEVLKKIKDKFKSWVWTDSERATELVESYNKRYNNIAPRRFDGSHLTLPGVSLRFKLHPHQLRAIWRMVQTGNTYLAHAVGAGKTIEMIAGGMEQKRLGLIKKPMYVVPNHMLEQFSNEFMELYPLANIMVADDENFSAERRKAFIASATLNNPDAIVITHEAYKRIGVKEESVGPIRDEIITDLELELSSLSKGQDARVRRSQLEQQIEAVTQRFDRIIGAGGKDSTIKFEDIGVDFVFADEAHVFRKLDFHTSQQIKGIDPNGSKAALDMYVKTRWLEKQRPGRSMVFASGTPVTNTMGELYTIMRFFAQEELDRAGISTFDAWSRQFGEVVPALEPNAAGKYELIERFAKFDNVPELMSRVRQFMDVLTSESLGALVKRPDLKGGKPNLNIVEGNESLRRYMEGQLATRIETSKKWKPSPQEPNNPDPIVAIITDGRFAAIDPRFFGGTLKQGERSILMEMADKIVAEHKATANNVYLDKQGKPEPLKGGTQIVFYNLGFGESSQAARGFNARAAFTKYLTDGGIPRDQIAWFDEANTDAKKEAVFKDVRAGKIRVLIGSAKKMGTGVNVQKRLTTLHYQDPPWYPADVEQPHGRIIRQGNQNNEVAIEWYTTKGTYQSTMWQMVGRKQRFIDQAFTGDKSLRSMDDMGEASLFEQAAAVASGDPRALQLAGLRQDVERLERLQKAHASEQINVRSELRNAEWWIDHGQKKIERLAAVFKTIGERYYSFTSAKVGKAQYDKVGEFGQALKDAFNAKAAEMFAAGDIDAKATIAELPSGVEVLMTPQTDAKDKMSGSFAMMALVGDMEFRVAEGSSFGETVDAVGLARRVLNVINSIEQDLKNERTKVTDLEQQETKLRKKFGAPFEYEQELAEKYGELKALEDQLKAEGKEKPPAAAPVIREDGSAEGEAPGAQQLNDITRPLPATIKVDGKDRPTRNSEGRQIHPAAEGVRNFWKWFGDSKVVDEQGRPLVVYHGTRHSFDAFNPDGRRGKPRLHYFSDDPAVASEYAGDVRYGTPNVMPSHVSLQKPFTFNANGEQWGSLPLSLFPPGIAVHFDERNILRGREGQEPLIGFSEVIRGALAAGYDGVIADGIRDGGGPYGEQNPRRVVVASRPTQIKSATGNTGAFDEAATSILNDLSTAPSAAFADKPEQVRANALIKLKGLERRRNDGKITEAEYRLGVRQLIDKLEQIKEDRKDRFIEKGGRRRGADWIVAQLRRGVADNKIARENADFAEWLLDQNPNLANDLGISMTTLGTKGVAGNYNPLARVIRIFTETNQSGTEVHEILHHTERMMPLEVQDGLMKEWQRAWDAAYKAGDAKLRAALDDMMAANLGDAKALDRYLEAFAKGTLKYDQHYQLASPSEFWAVNATRILSGRFAAKGSWVKTAIQWFKEFVQRVKAMLGLRSDAPILKALDEVMNGEGVFQPKARMMLDRVIGADQSGAVAYNDIVRKVQNNVVQFFGNRNESLKTFGAFNKTLSTQYHKALKDRDYGRVFGFANAMQNHVSIAAIRPAELAPGVLPRVDDVKSALKTVWKGKQANADIDGATKAIFAGTLYGKDVMQGKVFSDDDLRNQFKLTDTGIALYKQARAAIDASLDELAAAEAFSMAQGFVPKVIRRGLIDNPQSAPAVLAMELGKQIKMLKAAIKSAETAGNEEQKAQLEASLEAYINTQRTVDKIFTTAKNLKAAGYAPLMRFGKYTVTVQAIDPETGNLLRDENGDSITEFYGQYETEGEAISVRNEKQALYKDRDDLRVTTGVKSQTAHELYAGISPETLALFSDAIGAGDTMKKYYQLALSERSALKRRLERKGTAGFSEDMPRVLSNFITSNARFAAQRYYLRDLNNAIKFIPKEKGDVLDEAMSLKKFMNDPNDPGAPISSVMFAWFLGGSVASAIVNMTQPIMMTAPYLSQHGVGRATAAIAKAMPYALGKKQITDTELRDALKRASQEGVVDAQEIFHLYSRGAQSVASGLANTLAKIPGVGGKIKAGSESARARINAFLTLWGSMFSLAEKFNRKLTFIAAWEVAKAKGEKDPFAFAVRAVNETQGIYNKVNRPNWARGTFGRTLLTFKQFSIMYVELLSRMWKRGGPEGKRAALMMLAVLMLASGEEGLPFAQDLDDLIDTVGQLFGLDTNMRRNKRRLAHEILGKTGGDLFLYGISSQLPLDVAGRLGVGNLIPGSGILKQSDKELMSRNVAEIFGPAAGMATQISDAYEAYAEGNAKKALSNLAPKAVKDVLSGLDMADKGYATDTRGRKTTEVTAGEAAIKAVGFNPTTIAQLTRATMPEQQGLALQRRTESAILDQWVRGIIDKDQEMVNKAQSKLNQWNRDNPDTPIQITGAQIKSRIREQGTDKKTRLIKSAPKEMRGRVAEGLDDLE